MKLRVLAQTDHLTPEDLESIYELTYKYQMLKQEAAIGDYGVPQTLPDQAYMAFESVQQELTDALNGAYPNLTTTYEWWLESHQQDAEESIYELTSDMVNEDIRGATGYRDFLTVFTEDEIKETLVAERPELKQYETLDEMIDYTETLSPREESVLFKAVKQAIQDHPDLGEIIDDRLDAARQSFYDDTAITDIQNMYDKLESDWGDLDTNIQLFQEALTTAHNNGSMAEHLLNDSHATRFLQQLSNNPAYAEKWDQDLAKLLGYPLKSRSPKSEWFVSSYLKRAIKALEAAMTKLRVHADEWSKDRGYSVAFGLFFDPDVPEDPQAEEKALKDLEQLFGMPAEINGHEGDSTSGQFKHWVSPEKLQEIYSYCHNASEYGTLVLNTGVEVHFYAVEGHFGREAPVDLVDWPDKFNMQDKQEDSEFCTCGGPGKGFSMGRKTFVNCTKCGKPKPPDYTEDFERAGKTKLRVEAGDNVRRIQFVEQRYEALKSMLGRPPTIEELAEEFNIDVKAVESIIDDIPSLSNVYRNPSIAVQPEKDQSNDFKRQIQEECSDILGISPEELAGASVKTTLQHVTKYKRDSEDPNWTPPYDVQQFYGEVFDEYIPDGE